ncbi:hypothetical protein PHO31112_04640 [Pandoraea horticolens]|uniref:Uncharacterized protein n=1 Tax=Pandoraea horticolens TaxID=2508298 RepID=A0A5E4YNV7_9BURK|nr:hypothetical protein PHO31112_04640 [Pandoraea horticolens]
MYTWRECLAIKAAREISVYGEIPIGAEVGRMVACMANGVA